MNREEQYQWIDEQQYRDPDWADTESSIRRMAVDIRNRLLDRGSHEQVSAYVRVRDQESPLGMRTERIDFTLQRLGGLEELLLIEEIIRRKMYA